MSRVAGQVLKSSSNRTPGSVATVGTCSIASKSLANVAVYNVGGFKGATNVSFVVVIISDGGAFTGSVKYIGRMAVVGTKSFEVVVS